MLNTAHMGWFSSDRTVRDYAREIWRVPLGHLITAQRDRVPSSGREFGSRQLVARQVARPDDLTMVGDRGIGG